MLGQRIIAMIVTLPYAWVRYYLSIWLSWVIRLAGFVGVRPNGFIPSAKLIELNSIVDHLHAREDLYRKAIRELQEDLDASDSDRKKALKNLRRTKEEISVLSDRLSTLRQEYEKGAGAAQEEPGTVDVTVRRQTPMNSVVVHISFVVMVLTVSLFSRRVPGGGLPWKLVLSVFFPMTWIYFSSILGSPTYASQAILFLCSCWALNGFIFAHLVSFNGLL